MRGKPKVPTDRYLYASGRIRALEIRLFDSGRLNHLYEAHAIDDINRLLTESSYPEASNPETRLSLESEAAFQLMSDLFPDRTFVDALMAFHDFHNLKAVLKNLTLAWPKSTDTDDGNKADELPESAGPFGLVGPAALDPLFQRPSIVDPHVLFMAVRDRQPDQIPGWLYSAAVKAAKVYQHSYDISDIDLALDRLSYQFVLDKADRLGNAFFNSYLKLKIDMTNLGLLLRTRYLRSGTDYLEQVLLLGGTVPNSRILDLYQGTAEQIKSAYAGTACEKLAELAEEYGQHGSAGRFSLRSDNLIIEHIRQTRLLWRGPELLLSYLIAREMEIKNVRIALTCLRNGLPMSQARDLNRDNYLTWR